MEKSYFGHQIDQTIRSAERLVRKLREVQSNYADKRIDEALEEATKAAKLSEGVTLMARALPAYSGHPRAQSMVLEAMEETIPIEMGFTEQGWFYLHMPILLPRKEKSNRSYIRGYLYPALEKFMQNKGKIRYRNCVLIFRHVYDSHRPEREYRDHDNIELNTVVDAIAMFFLVDDTPLECRHYYCSVAGDEERTEVYIVPRDQFPSWLAMENWPEKLRKKLYVNLPETAEK